MIIFGQGALRAHPYVLREIHAVAEPDDAAALRSFDEAFFGHVAFSVSNIARALWMGLTRARFVAAPSGKHTRRYFQQLTRFASAFACAADMAMFVVGGALKRRERLSARLGDVLSHLYLASCALKRFHDDGEPVEDLPLLHWCLQDTLARMQDAFYGLFQNLPNAPVRGLLRFVIFPWGRELMPPADRVGHAVCGLVLASGDARERLTSGMFVPQDENDPIAVLEAALVAAEQSGPIEQKIRAARKSGNLAAGPLRQDVEIAAALGIISTAEAQLIERARALRRKAIMVDDFPKDLQKSEIYQTTQPVMHG
jgi:acyl-CoA dehydrogenase